MTKLKQNKSANYLTDYKVKTEVLSQFPLKLRYELSGVTNKTPDSASLDKELTFTYAYIPEDGGEVVDHLLYGLLTSNTENAYTFNIKGGNFSEDPYVESVKGMNGVNAIEYVFEKREDNLFDAKMFFEVTFKASIETIEDYYVAHSQLVYFVNIDGVIVGSYIDVILPQSDAQVEIDEVLELENQES